MKKILLLFLTFLSFTFILTGCKKDANLPTDNNSEYIPEEDELTTINRKIIYEVNADIYTEDLNETIATIKKNLNDDEWLDLEEIYEQDAHLVIRVKSSRLDSYLNTIFKDNDVSNFQKRATDISQKYQDKSDLILTYEKERDRLLELYENASFSEVLSISNRLSQIEIEIRKLQGELNKFDSLVDYSTITLDITTDEVNDEVSFGSRVKNAFTSGYHALIDFFEVIVIIVVALTPWLVVIVPLGLVIYWLRKRYKAKQTAKETPTNKH